MIVKGKHIELSVTEIESLRLQAEYAALDQQAAESRRLSEETFLKAQIRPASKFPAVADAFRRLHV